MTTDNGYRLPKIRSILRPLHYKSMGESWKVPLLNKHHYKHYHTSGYRLTRHHAWEKCDQWPIIISPGSYQVIKVTSSLFAITFDTSQNDENALVDLRSTIQIVISNMTFSDQIMTLILGQIFNMTLLCYIMVQSTRLDSRNTILNVVPFLSQRLLQKTSIKTTTGCKKVPHVKWIRVYLSRELEGLFERF